VCVWLKEKKHKTKQHLPVSMGSPCLSAQEYLVTHRACLCSVFLMQHSLPSCPHSVSFLLAVDHRGCSLGRSYLSGRVLAALPSS